MAEGSGRKDAASGGERPQLSKLLIGNTFIDLAIFVASIVRPEALSVMFVNGLSAFECLFTPSANTSHADGNVTARLFGHAFLAHMFIRGGTAVSLESAVMRRLCVVSYLLEVFLFATEVASSSMSPIVLVPLVGACTFHCSFAICLTEQIISQCLWPSASIHTSRVARIPSSAHSVHSLNKQIQISYRHKIHLVVKHDVSASGQRHAP